MVEPAITWRIGQAAPWGEGLLVGTLTNLAKIGAQREVPFAIRHAREKRGTAVLLLLYSFSHGTVHT
jgi:hypothetical protein